MGGAINQGKEFDQFYTEDSVAASCVARLLDFLATENVYIDRVFLEPAAGDGAFLRALEKHTESNYFACDIDPHNEHIVKKDFLQDDITNLLPNKDITITIGNPPFGNRARLAAAFINKAFDYSNLVAFVLPLQFQKYSAQNKLIPEARLVLDQALPKDSFVFNGKIYPVRCCFQVWTKLKIAKDLRLRNLPITKHKDFDMWQYNNTKGAEKYFDKQAYGWDFAVPRQGYKDYSIKETNPEKMDHHTQWIFFKAHNQTILNNLMAIDYGKLSKKNISIPGFGKADVISEYERLFGDS